MRPISASLYAFSRGNGMLEVFVNCVCGGCCVSGCRGDGGGRGPQGGRAAVCPGVGSGLMADAGDAACQPMLSATAALCVGDGSYTAGFQTITLNICKQIKKQNHPVRMETSAFLSLSALSPLHLPSRVLEEVGEGGRLSLQALPVPSLPGAPSTPRAASMDRYIRSSRPTPRVLGMPRHLRRIFSSPGSCPDSATETHHTQGGFGCPYLATFSPPSFKATLELASKGE